MPRPTFPILLLAFTLAAPASTAVAADPMPQPDCHGQSIKDAEGDSTDSSPAATGAGVPSADLIGGWVTYDPATGKAQANIQVANLTEGERNPGYTGIGWELGFTASKTFFVRGFSDDSATTFSWGEPRAVTDDQTAPRMAGTTTGKLFPGKGGVIQIDIPLADMGIKPGESLKALTSQVRQWVTKPAVIPNPPPEVPFYSYAPIYDEAAGKGTVALGPCAVAAGTAPVIPVVGAPPATGPAKLALKIALPKVTAKKANRARKLTVKLSGTASGVVAVLKAGTSPKGKTVASGRLPSVKGTGKLVLKLKGKLRKGVYTLFVTARNADGKAAEGALSVKAR